MHGLYLFKDLETWNWEIERERERYSFYYFFLTSKKFRSVGTKIDVLAMLCYWCKKSASEETWRVTQQSRSWSYTATRSSKYSRNPLYRYGDLFLNRSFGVLWNVKKFCITGIERSSRIACLDTKTSFRVGCSDTERSYKISCTYKESFFKIGCSGAEKL